MTFVCIFGRSQPLSYMVGGIFFGFSKVDFFLILGLTYWFLVGNKGIESQYNLFVLS